MSKLTFAELSFNNSNTPVSERFDDIYFSTQDGLAESHYVFQEGNQLWEKWQQHRQPFFVIAETGFGTGLNFFAVAERFNAFLSEFPNAPLKRLYFISFEKFPLRSTQLADIHRSYPQFAEFSAKLTACWQPRQVGCQRYHFEQVYLDIWFGDLHQNLPQLSDHYNNSVDCWFLDGFSPDKNPEMWNEKLYQQMFRLTKAGGSFATFTASSNVRRGLQAVGFEVKKRKGFGKKREMLWGEKPVAQNENVLAYPYFYQQNQTSSDDVAIVGGGIASLAVALSLLERGKKVTLYCKDEQLAKNASGNLQGAIYPQLSDDDERNVRFYVHSFDYALQRFKQLAQAVKFEHQFSGVALYAYNEKNAQKLQKMAEQGWDSELYQLCSAESLSEKIGLPVQNGGAFIAQGGWLSPVQFVQRAFAWLAERGLKIVLNHKVENPEWRAGQWHWQYQGQSFSHQTLILANGHLLTEFSQTHGIPLYPVRGQVSQVPTNQALAKLKCVVCYDGYITPMSAQQTHCIGASHFRDNADETFSLAEHEQNIAKLQQNLTACDWTQGIDFSANLAKVGIRSAFRDRVPMVGAVPDFGAQKADYANLYNQLRRKEKVTQARCYPNLYTVAGLGSRGLTTAFLLGEVLACQLCGEPQPLSQDILHALSTNRSWVRNLLKGRQVA
ncbi:MULTISPECIES: bifunctional tRNA (5-methylaminomethyl-2-thiouridine)(34)-methyltransferase MnmD/FAD-dependent 5-carboxymethylaminomethyl-2-thiouridine(34) oxidoreductase MnmC [Glaesserella]|uniref:tRNA 5-methylaminomethyl-2-thiouridine biosynthesis bifunctional protein MnmC n=1 Tax=Glaesserella australis TaxID=2094024 RepID=A0A328BXR3_9PAST|nr:MULTISPECIES: bifunctional tRNA (5-methylaminomethyl-2-thiouridine)(34)-methyltransferase MnmD/FAD-dependent 5-carboxymethylaminomethyl-2-thiouridine(34) oxidoreductase MnmC [Glaesserella]AUI65743.1 bifunctional tRNA (5-methylaminomethyl-2-thiouridine)(34)-methyltransferase MnmD/FAD-dependent 5-carboxymethylaminomethyl-2-thiouridine(34) oxidoreductase MnmC [Glaesserella sp. 15-184]RAL18973.1 bifunctional tRNA (5-methylaminomethyl-2-thiouridine)(34)-methyltransferase MnmD/FAD-dependent 5-carbox